MNHIDIEIDTTVSNISKVALIVDGQRFETLEESKERKAQTVLPIIESLLAEHHLSLDDISDITVSVGPGSFTGIRIGVAIANALGFILHVPVNGVSDMTAVPLYS